MKSWIALFSVVVLVGLLSQCEIPKATLETNIGPHTSAQFNALTREEQIKTCAGCHTEAFENEMKGPHAHSYKALDELQSYMQTPDYHLAFYKDFVHESRPVQCMGCHAPEDLFANFYVDHLVAPDSLIASWHAAKPKLPKPRKNGLQSGVDCLTCHYDGAQVITSGDFVPSTTMPPAKSCSPKASAFFSSDYSCYSCHSVSFEGRAHPEPLANQQSDNTNPTCISCHQEYDEHGKGTHYFYWKTDAPDKVRPERLSKFFEPIQAIRKANEVEVMWMNTLMPHPMSRAPEWYLDVAITNTTGAVQAEHRTYINRKEEHDRTVLKTFGKNVLPGAFGFDPVYKLDTLVMVLPLKKTASSEPLTVKTRAYAKSQYWHHDSIGVLQATHEKGVR